MTPKFRAWTEEGKVMYYDVYPFKDDTLLLSYDEIAFDEVPASDFILMQSTGLKDVHGKDVYEGDIIKDSEDFIAQVVYDKEYAGFGLNYQPFDLVDGLSVTFEELRKEYRNTFEVIGNIYENLSLIC